MSAKTTPVTIFADIPEEVLATVDYRQILNAMRLALSVVTAQDVQFTVEVHDFEEVED